MTRIGVVMCFRRRKKIENFNYDEYEKRLKDDTKSQLIQYVITLTKLLDQMRNSDYRLSVIIGEKEKILMENNNLKKKIFLRDHEIVFINNRNLMLEKKNILMSELLLNIQ